MIRNMNASRMAVIVELAKVILNDIAVLEIDRRFFRHNTRILRNIASPNTSLERKRRTLIRKPEMIIRLLRD